MLAIYYTMNIITAGYGEMFPTNNIERICTMVIILLGDALFAFAFGMMASLALESDSKDSLKGFLNNCEKHKQVLKVHVIDEDILNKFEKFYAYK